ncbi:hypothetical protein B0H34DRAFT_499069 [Crassisporium funariophilum]|nr:hypothetical protein B0H34DRAFT_499069 [Crassisporium funariophilum]
MRPPLWISWRGSFAASFHKTVQTTVHTGPKHLNQSSRYLHSNALDATPKSEIPRISAENVLALNQRLVGLVKDAQYPKANLLLFRLLENKVHVQHNPIYEKAALAGLASPDPQRSYDAFVTWFSLVPRRNELADLGPGVCNNSQSDLNVYRDTRFTLLKSGKPAKNLRYIMAFGKIMASKGFTHSILLDVARLVLRFANKEQAIAYLTKLEEGAMVYYQNQGQSQEEQKIAIAKRCREVVVALFAEKGWLGEAVELMQKERDFKLKEEIYQLVLTKLGGDKDGTAALVRQLRARDDSRPT